MATITSDSTVTRPAGQQESFRAAHFRAAPLHAGMDTVEIQAALDLLAAQLRDLWSSALADGDFHRVSRLADAGHAVHRAAVALAPDSVATGG